MSDEIDNNSGIKWIHHVDLSSNYKEYTSGSAYRASQSNSILVQKNHLSEMIKEQIGELKEKRIKKSKVEIPEELWIEVLSIINNRHEDYYASIDPNTGKYGNEIKSSVITTNNNSPFRQIKSIFYQIYKMPISQAERIVKDDPRFKLGNICDPGISAKRKNVKPTISTFIIDELKSKGFIGTCIVRIIQKDKNSKSSNKKAKSSFKNNLTVQTGVYALDNEDYIFIFRNKNDNNKIKCFVKKDTNVNYPLLSDFSPFYPDNLNWLSIKFKNVTNRLISLNESDNSDSNKVRGLLHQLLKNDSQMKIVDIGEERIILEAPSGNLVVAEFENIQIDIDHLKTYVPKIIKSLEKNCKLRCINNRRNRKLVRNEIYSFDSIKDKRNVNYRNTDVVIIKDKNNNKIISRISNFKIV